MSDPKPLKELLDIVSEPSRQIDSTFWLERTLAERLRKLQERHRLYSEVLNGPNKGLRYCLCGHTWPCHDFEILDGN